jgi:DNA primase
VIFKTIKDKIDLKTYLSKYLKFNKDFALCPFHEEKTPSFFCKDGDTSFHCFSCGISGDIFDFIEKHLGYSKMDAIKLLAEELGVRLNEGDQKYAKDVQELQEKNIRIVSQFKANISQAEQYLVSRAISSEMSNRFDIGYDPSRNAIYFPIRNRHNKIVGGSFRYIVPADGQPKYRNTASDVYGYFKKSEILYNLASARNEIKKKNTLYIVEGYVDVISLVQIGLDNSVGMLGSYITKEQATILKEFINQDCQIVLIPDNDEAGRKSIEKNYLLLRAFFSENSIKVAQMPDDNKDFNEYFVKVKAKYPDVELNYLYEDFEFVRNPIFAEIELVRQIVSEENLDVQQQYIRIKKFIETIRKNPIIYESCLDELSKLWNKKREIIESYFGNVKDITTTTFVSDIMEMVDKYTYFVKNVDNQRIKLGYKDLNRMIRGINPGEVLFITGRASVGKTAFILNLLSKITKNQNVNALFFSLEQQSEQIAERMLAMANNRFAWEIEKMFKEDDAEITDVIRKYIDEFKGICVVDKDSLTIENIEQIILHNNILKTPAQIVAIDYLGYIKTPHSDNPYVATSNLAKELKALAKRLNIVLIVLNQLSREGGSGGVPVTMRMSRDSGVIEESADVLLGMWRPDLAEGLTQQEKDNLVKEGNFHIEVLKNRSGRTGKVTLHLNHETLRLSDIVWTQAGV